MGQHKFYISDKAGNVYIRLLPEIRKTINDILRDTFYDALNKAEKSIKDKTKS